MGLDNLWRAFGLVAGTFLSEDATCIAAGLLIRSEQLAWPLSLGACTAGIFLGDLGLWLIGRLMGRRILAIGWVRARLSERRVERTAEWLDRRGWAAVLAARFMPGARLPVYLTAGMLGRRADRFACWALLAALLWTPLLVLTVAAFGDVAAAPFRSWLGAGWLSFALALLAVWLCVRLATLVATSSGRNRLLARASRIWRWEFWPAWLFYAPLVPWIGLLALRHRGLMTPTAANPGISPHGGIVGESKFDILSRLPREWSVPSAFFPPAPTTERISRLRTVMAEQGWTFPLILKPDAGQRGAGVRLVRDEATAARYFAEHTQPLLAQVYHPGPFEAGIFYYRMPDEPRGRIFSITDKHFPILVGDGVSTVESLIWRHPRLRMQADTFLARLNGQAEAILMAGERLPLTIAGNHCQGTLFRDGAHLITPELETVVDEISRGCDGFFFGRFDVRYGDRDALRAGRGFAVVELNGITSESTNLYDPSWSLWRAYRTLMRQWAILFAIGDRNRRNGHPPSTLLDVIRDARRFYRERRVSLLSD